MRVLTFNWHEAYISLLAKTGVTLDVVERFKGGSRVWFYETRPLPANVRIVSEATARRRLRARRYDAVVCHNIKDLQWVQEWPVRKIVVFHNRLSTEIALGRHTVDITQYRREVAALVHATQDVEMVFISESKRSDWGLAGTVIPPGIDPREYGGYHGSHAGVLRVGNFMRQRDLMLGFSIQQQVVNGLPSLLLGLNEPTDGGRFTRSWDDLRDAFRRYRVYLNTTIHPYEDGYNLSMLEAMATGAPVVTLANPTSPIVDGVNGFVSSDPAELRSRVVQLLGDLDLAKRLGAEGRRTVERQFGLPRFVERWTRMLTGGRDRIRRPAAAVRPLPGPRPQRRLRILLAYVSYPATTARYLETSLRRSHDVITVGPAIGPEIIKAWNLEGMREPVRPHDIPCRPDVDLERVIRALPSSRRPDFVLWVESVPGYRPRHVPSLDCPTAAYVIDSHLNLSSHLEWATRFDHVFVAQRAYVDTFRAAGCRSVHWLPLACDPAVHGRARVDTRHDIAFVGSLTPQHQQRRQRIERLAARFAVHVERSFLRDMARTLSASRIVLNDAIKNDLNMRVFEALASGAMLLTDRAPNSGLETMFLDREHVVYYDDDNLEDLAGYYLEHPTEREAIAGRGREEVLRWHTYDHRAASLVETVLEGAVHAAHDPTRTLVTADPLLAEGTTLIRQQKHDAALTRLRIISTQRDLDPLEWVECHTAVAECLQTTGQGDDVAARHHAALQSFDPDTAARVFPILAA